MTALLVRHPPSLVSTSRASSSSSSSASSPWLN